MAAAKKLNTVFAAKLAPEESRTRNPVLRQGAFLAIKNPMDLRAKIILCLLVFVSMAQAEWETDYQRFLANPDSKLAPAHSQLIDQSHYVFIGGYFNELVRGHYFGTMVETLKDLGATEVSRVFPSSFSGAGSNVPVLYKRLLKLYEQGGGRPLTAMGHSKGALELFATVLQYPELLREGFINEIILFQGPVGGNDLMDRQGFIKRLLANSLFMASGFNSLKTAQIHKLIEEKINLLSEEDFKLLDSKVKYIISAKKPSQFGRALSVGSYLVPLNIPYDGLVARQNMWIPGLGHVIADIPNLDHLEVAVGKETPIVDNYSEVKTRAFTKAYLTNTFKSRNPRNTEYRILTQTLIAERNRAPSCRVALGL